MTDTVKAWIEERQTIHGRSGEYLSVNNPKSVAAIVDAHNNLPRALDAIERVLERHQPVNGPWTPYEEFCDECSCAPRSVWVSWPCATVRAIEGAINE